MSVQPIDLRIADLGHVKLAYVEAGSGEPVVFVHGIPNDYRAWNSQIGSFSGKYHVIAYSRRLAQPNENTMDYEKSTIENNSADLVGFIEELGISPVHLVGHSYGGFALALFSSTTPPVYTSSTPIWAASTSTFLQELKTKVSMTRPFVSHPSLSTFA